MYEMFKGIPDYLTKNLQEKVTNNELNDYQVFGKAVEEVLFQLLTNYFNEQNIIFELIPAKSKNDFPDFKLVINQKTFGFEVKAAELSKGPNNDMGTLKNYPDKIRDYSDELYCIFVKYSKATAKNGISIKKVYFDKIYKFIGQSTPKDSNQNLLKYRKKDGNLRPKSWADFETVVYFNSLKEFSNAILVTVPYRAEKLIEEHIESLDLGGITRIKEKLRVVEGKLE